jgi:hypothetical protein
MSVLTQFTGDFQPKDADLTALAALSSNGVVVRTGTATYSTKTAPSGAIVGTSDSQEFTNKTIKGTKETVYTISDGSSVDINPANGGIQIWTLGASRTPTANNFSAGHSVLLLIADGSAYTVTWTTINVKWVGGVAPTLSTTQWSCIELWSTGSSIHGAYVGDVA